MTADTPAPTPTRGRSRKTSPVLEGMLAGRAVETVSLDRIDLHDTTFRFRVGLRFGDLTDSIRQNGQQMPVVLRRRPGQALLQVVSGFRRLSAIAKLGWPTCSAVVLEGQTDSDLFRLSVLENEARKTYSDLDRAYVIVKHRELGMSAGDIAKDLMGLSRRQTERLQKLTTLPPVLQAAISDHAMSTTQALVLQQLVDKHGTEQVDLAHWVGRASEGQMSVGQLKTAIGKHVRAGQGGEVRLFKRDVDEATGGPVVRLLPVRLSLQTMAAEDKAQVAAALRELAAVVEGV